MLAVLQRFHYLTFPIQSNAAMNCNHFNYLQDSLSGAQVVKDIF